MPVKGWEAWGNVTPSSYSFKRITGRGVEGLGVGGFKTLATDVCGAFPTLSWFNSCQPYLEDISPCSDWL